MWQMMCYFAECYISEKRINFPEMTSSWEDISSNPTPPPPPNFEEMIQPHTHYSAISWKYYYVYTKETAMGRETVQPYLTHSRHF